MTLVMPYNVHEDTTYHKETARYTVTTLPQVRFTQTDALTNITELRCQLASLQVKISCMTAIGSIMSMWRV